MTTLLRCSAGEFPVSTGWARSSLRGPWTAFVEAAAADASKAAPTGACTLVLRREDRSEDIFTGFVRRATIDKPQAKLSATLVGGAGRLLEQLLVDDMAAAATEIPCGIVLRKLADAAGETLEDGVEAALDAFTLKRWKSAPGLTGWEAIDAFVAELARLKGLDLGWRLLPSGKLWAGLETWPVLKHKAQPLDPDPDDGTVTYAPDGAALLAGHTIDDRRVVEVVYMLQPGGSRALVRAAVAGDPPHAPALQLYRASYPAAVVKQHADGTLDVRCDDPRMGDLVAVPLYVGIPGCKVTVPVDPDPAKTARVLVRFENASPAGAFASALEQDDDADKAFALVADGVDIGSISVVAPPGTLGGPCAISYTGPGVLNLGELAATLNLGVITGPGHKYAKGVRGS